MRYPVNPLSASQMMKLGFCFYATSQYFSFLIFRVFKLHFCQRKRLGVVGELEFRLPITEAQ